MDIQYQPNDDLVLDSTINEEYSNWSPTTTIEEIIKIDLSKEYTIQYNEEYPNGSDITFIDTTGTIIYVDEEETTPHHKITSGTVTILKIPFINDKIKEVADTYFTETEEKYRLTDCQLKLTSAKAAAYDESLRLLHEKIYNTEDANIIDYILDPDSDFESHEQIYIWDSLQGSVQRDIYLSPRPEQVPSYIFECVDSTGVATYKQIYLEELPQSFGTLSNYYEFKVNDMTSYDSTSMVDITELPMIMKSPIFRRYCIEVFSSYTEVNILMLIDNVETEPTFQEDVIFQEDAFLQKWTGCCIFQIDVELDQLQTIKDRYSESLVTLSISGSEFVAYYDIDTMNMQVRIANNDTEFNLANVTDNWLRFNSTNYFNLNNNITVFPFEYTDETTVPVKFILPNVMNGKVFTLKDIGMAISRKQKTHNHSSLVYSETAEIRRDIRLEKYYVTELPYTISTDVIINLNLLNSSKFCQEETTITGLMEGDVLHALDLIKNVTVDLFYRNINTIDTFFYIKFTNDQTIQYLKRFLENDVILNILNTMTISVNCINETGTMIKEMIYLDFDNIVTRYVNEIDIVYVVKHTTQNQIININGIFDKQTIDMLKYQVEKPALSDSYIPADMIIVNNTQKTN